MMPIVATAAAEPTAETAGAAGFAPERQGTALAAGPRERSRDVGVGHGPKRDQHVLRDDRAPTRDQRRKRENKRRKTAFENLFSGIYDTLNTCFHKITKIF